MIEHKEISANGIRFSIVKEGIELGHAYLYLLHNDLHTESFGFVEDIFVEENSRGRGYGNLLMKAVLKMAKEKKCYKIICTSRYARERVHAWYEKLGFIDYGKEFRLES